MSNIKKAILAIVIIFAIGISLQYKYIAEFPSHVHAWSQSDRYALALGFERNNLNFFKPETFVMNHQFPDKFSKPHATSISSVDFPINDYIPAVVMKITGNSSPIIFRLYVFLISILGLWFLYKLAFLINKDFRLSMLVVILAATSPLFVYYQSGFIPTIPSLTAAIMGFYFYLKNTIQPSQKTLIYSYLFLTLATLCRTSFLIPLLAVFAVDFFSFFGQTTGKKEWKSRIPMMFVSLLTIGGFMLYNQYLRNKFGSLFLQDLMPPTSTTEAKGLLYLIQSNWKWQYFSKVHYFVFTLLFLAYVFHFAKNKYLQSIQQKRLLFLISVYTIGAIIFAFAMLKQFVAHDYYFLDSLFLPIILGSIYFTSHIKISSNKQIQIFSLVVLLILSIPLVLIAKKSQESRRETGTWDRTQTTINNFEGAEAFLDSLNVDKLAKILVLDAYAPNIPFILMNRKGYAVMTTSRANLKNAISWDYDYVVIQNEYFVSDIYSEYPEIITQIEKVADNGRISLCVRKSGKRDLADFLGLSDKTPVFKTTFSFDNSADVGWSNTKVDSTESFGYMESTDEFGITYKSNHLPFKKATVLQVTFRGKISQLLKECEMVCSLTEENKTSYYGSSKLSDYLKITDQWTEIRLLYYLPTINAQNHEFAWYLWNRGNEKVAYDDVVIEFY